LPLSWIQIMIHPDDFSKYSVVKILKAKSDVASVAQSVLEQLENVTGKKVQYVRSDNGGEYVNAVLRQYFLDKRIVHERTVPRNPEQNGAVKRLNRTLVEKIRCMLNESTILG
jgi:transposase InsO family protein